LAIALQPQQGADTAVHVLMGVGVAAAVTVVRVVLLERWPDFKTANDASNLQVLAPLQGNVLEIFQVAALPVRPRLGSETELVGSHGRWKRPCLQTAHMTI
jgi:hypothetical protein